MELLVFLLIIAFFLILVTPTEEETVVIPRFSCDIHKWETTTEGVLKCSKCGQRPSLEN